MVVSPASRAGSIGLRPGIAVGSVFGRSLRSLFGIRALALLALRENRTPNTEQRFVLRLSGSAGLRLYFLHDWSCSSCIPLATSLWQRGQGKQHGTGCTTCASGLWHGHAHFHDSVFPDLGSPEGNTIDSPRFIAHALATLTPVIVSAPLPTEQLLAISFQPLAGGGRRLPQWLLATGEWRAGGPLRPCLAVSPILRFSVSRLLSPVS
jgi:hypothetical protein